VIDYYYEFRPDTQQHLGIYFHYGFTHGYHPEQSPWEHRLQHTQLWTGSSRIWLENTNAAVLIRANGRDVHHGINARELTWIKLQAREIEL